MRKKLNLKGFIIIGLLVFFAYRFIAQEITLNRIESDMIAKEQELEELKESNLILEENLKTSGSDEYLERLARERLNMIKPGEQVVNSVATQESKETNGE